MASHCWCGLNEKGLHGFTSECLVPDGGLWEGVGEQPCWRRGATGDGLCGFNCPRQAQCPLVSLPAGQDASSQPLLQRLSASCYNNNRLTL